MCFCKPENVSQDNCCRCNTAAFTGHTKTSIDDVIFISCKDEVGAIPFYVVADHERDVGWGWISDLVFFPTPHFYLPLCLATSSCKSVVVSVRGTLSTKDMITDACTKDREISVEGLGVVYVHDGFLRVGFVCECSVVGDGQTDICKKQFSAQAAQHVIECMERHNVFTTAFGQGQPTAGYR